MQLPDEPETSPQINIVPMIDVIFAVLAFFVVSTLYLTRNEGLPVNLPEATTGIQQQQKPITVTINAQGDISLNQQPVQLETLTEKLQIEINPNQPTQVIINADEAVNHGRVIAVMDRLRTIPGIRLAIATTQP